jgi:RNA polymerase sigma-70 factor (ECF subfamily)
MPAGAVVSDDAAALRAFAATGDRTALNAFFVRNLDFMHRLALSRLGRAADADDAVQEAVLAVMAGAARFAGGDCRAWLATVVLNTARDWQRSRSRRIRREAMSVPTRPAPALDAEDGAALMAALAVLPEKLRVAVHLHYREAMPLPAVAGATGVPLRTAQSRVRLGLERLRALLGRPGLSAPDCAAALATLPLGQAPPAVHDAIPALMARPLPAAPAAATLSLPALLTGLGAAAVLVLVLAFPLDRPRPAAIAPPALAPAAPAAAPAANGQAAAAAADEAPLPLVHFSSRAATMAWGNHNRGLDLLASGDRRGARTVLQGVIDLELAPPDAIQVLAELCDCYYGLARVAALDGDPAAALAELDRAIAFGFDDAERVATDGDLAGVRALPAAAGLMERMRQRAEPHDEIGTLMVMDTGEPFTLVIAGSALCRARVLILDGDAAQRARLGALLDQGRPVMIRGSGGTLSTHFHFTVGSISALGEY